MTDFRIHGHKYNYYNYYYWSLVCFYLVIQVIIVVYSQSGVANVWCYNFLILRCIDTQPR